MHKWGNKGIPVRWNVMKPLPQWCFIPHPSIADKPLPISRLTPTSAISDPAKVSCKLDTHRSFNCEPPFLMDTNLDDDIKLSGPRWHNQPQQHSVLSYTIGWLCDLPIEFRAAKAMLDAVHTSPEQRNTDPNNYLFGSIGQYNIVITHHQTSDYEGSTARAHLRRSFPAVHLLLVVGIGGGVPRVDNDIRLGDVVVGTMGLSYETSRTAFDNDFSRTTSRVTDEGLRSAVTVLRARRLVDSSNIETILGKRFAAHPEFNHPQEPDLLFEAEYSHHPSASTCLHCDTSRIVRREERKTSEHKIHYGPIASGLTVLKDGRARDRIAHALDDGIICFEMGPPDLIDDLPTLHIRGISDYCDSHKYKAWQGYAAVTAAATARELLEILPFEQNVKVGIPPRMNTIEQGHSGPADDSDTSDAPSLFSSNVSVVSKSSISSVEQTQDNAPERLVDLFLSDSNLRSLYSAAIPKLSKDRFHRRHDRLLKRYFVRMRELCKTHDQLHAVRLLRQPNKRRRVTDLVYDDIAGWGNDVGPTQKKEERHELANPVPKTSADSDSSNAESEEEASGGERGASTGVEAAITLVGQFLTSGEPYMQFKASLRYLADGPTTISQALDCRSHSVLRKLLEKDFDNATSDEFQWLRELDEVGYSRNEMADMLLEEENDAPWIYCTPPALDAPTLQSLTGQQIGLSDISDVTETWTDPFSSRLKQHDIDMTIHKLCGLAGVVPWKLDEWAGEVTFESDCSVAMISYAESTRLGKGQKSPLITRLSQVLECFSIATGILQETGRCSSYFTLVRGPGTLPANHPPRPKSLELVRMMFSDAQDLQHSIETLQEGSPYALEHMSECAIKILAPLSINGSTVNHRPTAQGLSVGDVFHLCCLAAQVLCLGLVSFCQKHVSVPEPFFINRSLGQFILLGSTKALQKPQIHTYVTARLSSLTCLSSMTGGPLLTFSISEDSPEDDLLIETRDDEQAYDLVAGAENLLATWGPGQLITGDEGSGGLLAIRIRGGIISSDGNGHSFHWESGPGPDLHMLRPFDLETRMTIGSLVTENQACSFPENDWRGRCRLMDLGTCPSSWRPKERRLGGQVGPDQLAFKAHSTWVQDPEKTLKQNVLKQKAVWIVSYLSRYLGVQVSCCTGVARRVSLQHLLADLIPVFFTSHRGEKEWKLWNEKHNIIDAIKGGNFHEWLMESIQGPSPHIPGVLVGEGILQIVHQIITVLEDTGLTWDSKHLVVAWPRELDVVSGLKIACKDDSLWTKILADSADSSTFVYMTSQCLLIDGSACQHDATDWNVVTKSLVTAVSQHRAEPGPAPAWELQDGKSYHIWNLKSYILLRAEKKQTGPTRLFASESSIPLRYAKRHMFGGHWKSECLIKESTRPMDDAEEVIILARPRT